MFKYILIAIVVGAVAAAWPAKKSDAQVVADARQQILKSCVSTGTQNQALTPTQVDAFCTCSAERVIVELGTAGVRQLTSAKALPAPDLATTREIQQVCLERATQP